MQPKLMPKKLRIDKDKTFIFAVVSVAAALTVAALVITKGVWGQASYLGAVANKKEVAVQQLEANKQALGSLEDAYRTFDGQSPNLLDGNPESTDGWGGSNATLVLDALPSKYDFPALAASIEKLLMGYNITGITGSDDSVAQTGANASGPVEMPFSFSVTTSYDGFKQLVTSFNRSIRPFQITMLDLSGSSMNLQVDIQAQTFYQPERGLQIEEVIVQ